MSNEIAFRYPNLSGSPAVPTAVENPLFAVFAGLSMWNGSAFVPQSDATAWTAECFFALTPISTHGSVFTGDYEANMPAGIDLTQSYTVRMYDNSGTPTPGSELGPVEVYDGMEGQIATQTNLIGTGRAIVQSPLTTGGEVTIFRGRDHKARDNTAWIFTDPGNWQSLVGATVTMSVRLTGDNSDPAP